MFLLSFGFFADAQESRAFNKGYRGQVEVGGILGVTKEIRNDAFSILTTHGYSYGDGFFLGAGAGLNVLTSDDITIPIFAVAKYNFVNSKISPFVDCRIGGEAILQNGVAFIASPGAGVEYRRFILRVGYLCEAGRLRERFQNPPYFATALFKSHSFQITMGISF